MRIITNLYDILQVDRTADDREIKKAYVRMLRKYPPEKAPEEFKKIREAYERLIDPISRAEYDAFTQYQGEIAHHDKMGDEALEKKDYKTAIKEYKKILIIEPKLTFARNKLGLALTYDGQYDAALVQFKELIKINPNNAVFYSNLACVYKKMANYDKAEEAWLKAYELDPINDNIILALSQLYYMDKKQYYKAIRFLKQCLGKNKDDAFQDFIYYFEMIKVYIFEHDTNSIERTIDKIEKITPDEKEAREYVAWNFGKLAYELYAAKLYNLAEKISKTALKMDNSNKTIETLYNNSKKLNQAFTLYDALSKDKRILSPLKAPIFYYLYGDEFKEEELKKIVKKI